MENKYVIVQDSRERKPLWKDNNHIITKKLDIGDYSIEGEEENISIERKTLIDLYGTLGREHNRFKKELQRALNLKYFAIVIEGSYTSCLNKTFDNSYKTRMPGKIITKILFTIHIKYGIPIFFTNGRIETKNIIKEIFNSYINNKTKKYIKNNNNKSI